MTGEVVKFFSRETHLRQTPWYEFSKRLSVGKFAGTADFTRAMGATYALKGVYADRAAKKVLSQDPVMRQFDSAVMQQSSFSLRTKLSEVLDSTDIRALYDQHAREVYFVGSPKHLSIFNGESQKGVAVEVQDPFQIHRLLRSASAQPRREFHSGENPTLEHSLGKFSLGKFSLPHPLDKLSASIEVTDLRLYNPSFGIGKVGDDNSLLASGFKDPDGFLHAMEDILEERLEIHHHYNPLNNYYCVSQSGYGHNYQRTSQPPNPYFSIDYGLRHIGPFIDIAGASELFGKQRTLKAEDKHAFLDDMTAFACVVEKTLNSLAQLAGINLDGEVVTLQWMGSRDYPAST